MASILPWLKSSRNSFRKFKIQILFIKRNIVPFKVLPIDCNAFMLALDPALETFLELYCRYSHIRAIFDFSITSFRLLKRVPRNGFLTRSNRKKSQKVISGEFDGYWMVFISWSKIHGTGTVRRWYYGAKSTPFLKL